jgi:DnaJ-class molecular chaperone
MEATIKCDECWGTGECDESPFDSCEACDGTGIVRAPDDEPALTDQALANRESTCCTAHTNLRGDDDLDV